MVQMQSAHGIPATHAIPAPAVSAHVIREARFWIQARCPRLARAALQTSQGTPYPAIAALMPLDPATISEFSSASPYGMARGASALWRLLEQGRTWRLGQILSTLTTLMPAQRWPALEHVARHADWYADGKDAAEIPKFLAELPDDHCVPALLGILRCQGNGAVPAHAQDTLLIAGSILSLFCEPRKCSWLTPARRREVLRVLAERFAHDAMQQAIAAIPGSLRDELLRKTMQLGDDAVGALMQLCRTPISAGGAAQTTFRSIVYLETARLNDSRRLGVILALAESFGTSGALCPDSLRSALERQCARLPGTLGPLAAEVLRLATALGPAPVPHASPAPHVARNLATLLPLPDEVPPDERTLLYGFLTLYVQPHPLDDDAAPTNPKADLLRRIQEGILTLPREAGTRRARLLWPFFRTPTLADIARCYAQFDSIAPQLSPEESQTLAGQIAAEVYARGQALPFPHWFFESLRKDLARPGREGHIRTLLATVMDRADAEGLSSSWLKLSALLGSAQPDMLAWLAERAGTLRAEHRATVRDYLLDDRACPLPLAPRAVAALLDGMLIDIANLVPPAGPQETEPAGFAMIRRLSARLPALDTGSTYIAIYLRRLRDISQKSAHRQLQALAPALGDEIRRLTGTAAPTARPAALKRKRDDEPARDASIRPVGKTDPEGKGASNIVLPSPDGGPQFPRARHRISGEESLKSKAAKAG